MSSFSSFIAGAALAMLLIAVTTTPTPALALTNTALCRPLNATLAPYCAGLVLADVPSDTNETFYDRTAESVVTGPLRAITCKYFQLKSYQCRKLFPSCTVVESSTGVQSASIDKLCESICDTAKVWTSGSDKCSQFSDAYWVSECGDAPFYTTDTTCTTIDGLSSESEDAEAWKYAVAGVAAFIGLVLIASFLRQYCREKGVGVNDSAAGLEDVTVSRTARQPKTWDAANDAEQSALVVVADAGGTVPTNAVVPM
jgi:hypothetical protein